MSAPSLETVAAWIRTSAPDRDEAPGGFARARTDEVAAAFGVEPTAALKILNKAAKAGLVYKAGRVRVDGSAFQGRQTGTVGWQLWEISFPDGYGS